MRPLPVLVLSTFFMSGWACSSHDDSGGKGHHGGGPDSGTIIFTGNGNGSGKDGGVFGNSGGQACAAQSAATEAAPLAIYVMFDESCSMSCPAEEGGPGLCCKGGPNPRIDLVRNAMDQFISNPESSGIAMGIGYFGNENVGQTSCNPADYAKEAVPIDLLPKNASALTNSLGQATPNGETPTGAAIRGACTYATAWKGLNPGYKTVILLVTDGYPEAPVTQDCKPSVADAEAAAQDCDTQSGIGTYVLGVGQNLDNLKGIAAAGGTNQAYLVGSMSSTVSQNVLDALNQIRNGAAVPCDFKIPPPPSGDTLNPALVNVTYIDATGAQKLITSAGSEAGCGTAGGWYYDNPTKPSVLKLCPTSCTDVTAALVVGAALGTGAHVDIQYGCATVGTTPT